MFCHILFLELFLVVQLSDSDNIVIVAQLYIILSVNHTGSILCTGGD